MVNLKLNSSLIQRLINKQSSLKVFTVSQSTAVTQKDDLTKEEELIVPTLINNEDDEARNAEIERKRNVSRLNPQHRNMLNNCLPYEESQSWIHETEKYKRMMFGRYGLASGVDPKICFPNKTDLKEREQFEKIAFTETIQEMIAKSKQSKIDEADAIVARENQIIKRLEKLEQWKIDLKLKIAKKEADAKSAKDRKDRLVEDVRRHFGYNVDPKDEKFKEMLELKEKEEKKRAKEEKRKVKEAKIMAKLTSKHGDGEKSSPIIEEETQK